MAFSSVLETLREIVVPRAQRLAAVPAGLLPKRLWRQLDPPLPIVRAAVASGLLTLFIGFFLGFGGFMAFATRSADMHNDWMLRNISTSCPGPRCADDGYRVALVPYGVSAITLFAFLFFTPLGLFSTYLVVSGFLRAVSAYVGDPRGDFLLSGLYWSTTGFAASLRAWRAREAREEREGAEVPDVLGTGEWASLPVDYVVISSRRKSSEWRSGAIILSSTDWYRLGTPIDREIDGHLRTLYPLTRLEVAEVVRRGIEYELPHLPPRYARKRSASHA